MLEDDVTRAHATDGWRRTTAGGGMPSWANRAAVLVRDDWNVECRRNNFPGRRDLDAYPGDIHNPRPRRAGSGAAQHARGSA